MVARGGRKTTAEQEESCKKEGFPSCVKQTLLHPIGGGGWTTDSASEEKGKKSDGSMHCTLGKMSLAAGDAIEGTIGVRVGFAIVHLR